MAGVSSSSRPLTADQLREALLPVIAPLAESLRQLGIGIARLAQLVSQERVRVPPVARSRSPAAGPLHNLGAYVVIPRTEARFLEERVRFAREWPLCAHSADASLQTDNSREVIALAIDSPDASIEQTLVRREQSSSPAGDVAQAVATVAIVHPGWTSPHFHPASAAAAADAVAAGTSVPKAIPLPT